MTFVYNFTHFGYDCAAGCLQNKLLFTTLLTLDMFVDCFLTGGNIQMTCLEKR